jgi:hypothetical protein
MGKKAQIINIVNFVRGVEPRLAMDLKKPLVEQMALLRKYQLPATFLLQYDALIQADFRTILAPLPGEKIELGAWLEICEPLCEAAHVVWKSKIPYPWDWHCDAGFTIAYTPKERKALLDAYMAKFHALYGVYPRSAGCWFMDALSLAYLKKKYHLSAFCVCRDQWGTDGYNLWGGYYSQAYYPSKKNFFSPAQHRKAQIDLPLFRMLGSDPIHQYDAGRDEDFNPSKWQPVFTLEPVYPSSGADPAWVDWFFKENYNGHCLSFAYAQAGQENSFGWERMKEGYSHQMGKIAAEVAAHHVVALTLEECGDYFTSHFRQTPSSAVMAFSDLSKEGKKSLWFDSRYYRLNLVYQDSRFWIRDAFFFDENRLEPYHTSISTSPSCVYEGLPLVDGYRWSGRGIEAGAFFYDSEGQSLALRKVRLLKENEKGFSLRLSFQKGITLLATISEKALSFTSKKKFPFSLHIQGLANDYVPSCLFEDRDLVLNYHDFTYRLSLKKGFFRKEEKKGLLASFLSEDGSLILHC